ncbi:G2/mitotic-specific cyclin-B2-like [Oppia nitens]|uniref:G2/mitotic-specific cyclin-B2-like n=1 Tax=Oppia nitens TaxID=1686743 RepID=UPI0023D99749|nr:G2/mitotic-specific cyclin-B2-like [Oppia nitens]
MSNIGENRQTSGVGIGGKLVGLKSRTTLALNSKRVPLAVSLRQNRAIGETNQRSNKAINKQTTTRVSRHTKSSKTSVNDENAEENKALAKSRIPIDVMKKSQINANKKTKAKVEPEVNIEDQEIGFSSQCLPDNVEDIDANDESNVFLTYSYVNDIYNYLRRLEKEQFVSPNFLSIQKEMTPRMRAVLVDWLINVHHQFKLLPETLYLGISIMDRFFMKEVISKDKIQLVGVTAFYIASKFEEIYPPDIKDFVMICDKLYQKRDIIKMELAILRSLNFELGRPLPIHFLRRNSKAAYADSRIHCVAKYLMELTLVEYECAHWRPSLLAATVLYVTLRILAETNDLSEKWTPTLAYYSNYSEQQLMSFASRVCKVILKSEKSKFQNCRQKYSSTKLMEISRIPQLKSPIIDEIAAIEP